MSVDTTTCVLISCDGCNWLAGDEDEGGQYHFSSVEKAVAYLVDTLQEDYPDEEIHWEFADGRWTCSHCRAKARCDAAGGHEWSEWWVSMDGHEAHRTCLREQCPGHEKKGVDTVPDLRLL